YLFRGHRPFIEDAPAEIAWGETFTIHTPQAAEIKWVSLIRPMATTHSQESSQRVVDVPFEHRAPCALKATLTKDPDLAPPGWYMLFLCDEHGVPSVARWV